MGFSIGDKVFIAASRIGRPNYPSALIETKVLDRRKRSIFVDNLAGDTRWIGTKFAHANLGLCVLTLGDLETEDTLLIPLAKSTLQFLRLLLPDEYVRRVELRSLKSLESFWSRSGAAYSHVVVIAHGRGDAVKLHDDGWVGADRLSHSFACDEPKHFTSLACRTGRSAFSKKCSEKPCCRSLIAPYHSAHGAVASMYLQTYFNLHLLAGNSEKVAYNRAAQPVSGQAQFRFWKNGKLTGKPS